MKKSNPYIKIYIYSEFEIIVNAIGPCLVNTDPSGFILIKTSAILDAICMYITQPQRDMLML